MSENTSSCIQLDCDDTDSEPPEIIWSCGDKCLAPWPTDGCLYEAKIIKIIKSPNRKTVVVQYDGFTRHDNETIPLQELKPLKKRKKSAKKCMTASSSTVCHNIDTPQCSAEIATQRLRTADVKASSTPAAAVAVTEKLACESDEELEDSSIVKVLDGTTGNKEKPYFPNLSFDICIQDLVLLDHSGKPSQHKVSYTVLRYLREYQKQGIQFLYSHYSQGHGALLADDMGLGKTVQVIGFIAAVQGKTGTEDDIQNNQLQFIRQLSSPGTSSPDRKVFLIIGLASILDNWAEELDMWGYFNVGKYHRGQKESTLSAARKNKLDVVLTTYETFRDNVDILNSVTWEAVIADEVHKIKGLKAEISQALRKLKCKKRYGLSGTPLQNSLDELWCVMDWISPGCLDDLKSFQKTFITPIMTGQAHEATKRQLAESRRAQNKLAQVCQKWMLRRTKALLKDQLPKKDELVVYCQLADIQNSIYEDIMNQDDMVYIMKQWEACPCGRDSSRGNCCFKQTPGGQSVQALTFTYMHLLLKAANHAALLWPCSNDGTQVKYSQQICQNLLNKHEGLVQQFGHSPFNMFTDPQCSGKMLVLTGLLKVFKKDNSKVVIFSLSTKLLDILEQYIIGKGYDYRRLDGQTPNHQRQSLVNEFNRDPSIFVFLASTKAGGVGLNLTGANAVVIFDPNWNPSHDLQAQDRIYRLGQHRDVRVYRLIAAGTIEENIYLRQIHKQQQASIGIEAKNARRYFSKGEIFGVENLFMVNKSERCVTEAILDRAQKVENSLHCVRIEKYVGPADFEEDEDGELTNSGNVAQTQARPSTSATLAQTEARPSTSTTLAQSTISSLPKLAINSVSSTLRTLLSSSVSDTCGVHDNQNKHYDSETDIEDDCNSAARNVSNTLDRERSGHKAAIKRRKYPSHQTKETGSVARGHTERKLVKKLPSRQLRLRESRSSRTSVEKVLDRCRVVHTHENSKLIGSSRAEDHMTKCALRDVYDRHQSSQTPARNCSPCSQISDESDDIGEEGHPQVCTEDDEPGSDVCSQPDGHPCPLVKPTVTDRRTIAVEQTPVASRSQHLEDLAGILGLTGIRLPQPVEMSSCKKTQLLGEFHTSKDRVETAELLRKHCAETMTQDHCTSQPISRKRHLPGDKTDNVPVQTNNTDNSVTVANISTALIPSLVNYTDETLAGKGASLQDLFELETGPKVRKETRLFEDPLEEFLFNAS